MRAAVAISARLRLAGPASPPASLPATANEESDDASLLFSSAILISGLVDGSDDDDDSLPL